jgi:hypothetical protein
MIRCMIAFPWLRAGCLFTLVFITAGCSKSTGSAAAAQAEPDSSPGATTTVRQKSKPSSKPERAKKPSEPAGIPAAAGPVQRVVRPTVPVPRHDDRLLAERGIHRYESKHLVLYTDIDPEHARALPPLMDEAYAAWEDYFGPLPPDREGNDFQMIGYIMADRDLFRETGLMTADIRIALEGVYKNQVFWMNDQPIDYYRRHLMIHEGTHCFMMAYPNPTNQFIWYVEGMAELFRAHQTDAEGHTRFRLFPRDRESFAGLGWIRLIHDDVRASGPRTIESVIGMHVNEFQKYNAYAWSWALCAFLDGHPRYRDRFRRVGALVTGRHGAAFEMGEVYKADWRDLSEEWLVYAGNICYGYEIERTALDPGPGKLLADHQTKLEIAADRGWQSSGILVERGKTYQIAAAGRCVVATVPKPWESEPQGISFRYHAGLPVGMLVAAIRSAEPLEKAPHTTMLEVLSIGREKQLMPDHTGTLYFRVNDYWNELGDNTGVFRVGVEEVKDK